MFSTSHLYPHSELLKKIDQLAVWQSITGPVNLYEKFCNPLRSDKHPSCYLKEQPDGNITLCDWSNSKYHGLTCLRALELYYNISSLEAMQQATQHLLPFHLIKLNPVVKKDNFKFALEFKYRDYNQDDYKYWTYQYDIPIEVLIEEEIYPILYYYRNSRKDPDRLYQFTADKYAYGISINNRRKLYQPFSKDFKWLTNFNEYDIGGKVDRESDILILTKSFKDYLVLKCHTKYNVQFVPSERIILNNFYIDVINEKYKFILILMDNDSTGQEAAKRFEEQIGAKSFGTWLEDANDPAEYYKEFRNLDIISKLIGNDSTNYTQILASNNRQVLSG